MKEILEIQEEQERVLEICRFTWTMKSASEVWSFERGIYDWYIQHRPACKSVYLPLFWIAIWRVVDKYPDESVLELMDRVSTIYKSLKKEIPYHTVASEVHCNKRLFPKLPSNVQVYGPGYNTNEGDDITCHEIPLLVFSRRFFSNTTRDIFCSYFISGEYRCRKQLNQFLYGEEGFCHKDFVVSFRVPYRFYCEILSRSKFVLAPRGTNITTYRFYEAIMYGAIPVYISDKFSLPYSDEVDWNSLAVLIDQNDIEMIPDILHRISAEQTLKMQAYGKWFKEKFINLNELCKRIFTHANQLNHEYNG